MASSVNLSFYGEKLLPVSKFRHLSIFFACQTLFDNESGVLPLIDASDIASGSCTIHVSHD